MPSDQEEDHNSMMDDEDLEDEEDDDEEDLESDDEEDEEDEVHHHPQPQPLPQPQIIKQVQVLHSPVPISTAAIRADSPPDHKRQRTTTITTIIPHPSSSSSTLAIPAPTPAPIHHEEEKKPSAFDDSRRLFQRLWTDEDEIGLLQGFLEYTSQRGGFKNSAYHHDTAPFYDQIKSRLQLDFNKNQLVEKLRRLKKKYRNVMSRINSGKDFSFKTPHDQATFEISKKIWSGIGGVGETALVNDEEHGNSQHVHNNTEINGTHTERKASASVSASAVKPKKRPHNRTAAEENASDPTNLSNCPVNSSVPNVIEETVKNCLSPLFKELMFSAINGTGNLRGLGGMNLNLSPLNFGGNSSMNNLSGAGERDMMDEKWRKQQILELEVYSKRVELVQEQIKLALEELRSTASQ